jgi:hypothetical protein
LDADTVKGYFEKMKDRFRVDHPEQNSYCLESVLFSMKEKFIEIYRSKVFKAIQNWKDYLVKKHNFSSMKSFESDICSKQESLSLNHLYNNQDISLKLKDIENIHSLLQKLSKKEKNCPLIKKSVSLLPETPVVRYIQKLKTTD